MATNLVKYGTMIEAGAATDAGKGLAVVFILEHQRAVVVKENDMNLLGAKGRS